MTRKGDSGIRRLARACVYSWNGLLWAVGNETSFRQEAVALAVLAPVALWLGESQVEQAMLIGSLLLLLLIELLNSGLEAAVDRAGEDFHPLAGRAKDLGSAAVLLAIVHACLIWGVIALPKLLASFSTLLSTLACIPA
jgi:diacylglycerol kinase (ATP)